MGKGDHGKPKTATPPLTVGRTKTLDDPLTTGLLAEVARNSATKDFDPAALQKLLDASEAEDEDDVAVIVDKPATHPRVRKRSG